MLFPICSKIMKISLTVQSFRTDTICILNIPKENNSEKHCGVMVLVVCLLSNEALYLFHLSCYRGDRILRLIISKGH